MSDADFTDLSDADFGPLDEPATAYSVPAAAGSSSAAETTPGGANAALGTGVISGESPDAADVLRQPDAGSIPATSIVPCPIPGCRETVAGAEPFAALQAHLEASHGLIPRDPPEPAPVAPQLALPEPDADLAALFDAPIDPQTGNAVIRVPGA